MGTTNAEAGTRVDEIAGGIYRISTPVRLAAIPGGFSFNQFLIVDEKPLLFHTGLRRQFALTRDAIASVMPPERLYHVASSHFEADECGALNEFLAVAPKARPLCGTISAMVSLGDVADRPPRGWPTAKRYRWASTRSDGSRRPTCRTRGTAGSCLRRPRGHSSAATFSPTAATGSPPLSKPTSSGPAKRFANRWTTSRTRAGVRALMEKLIALRPTTLATMHGSAWRGDGAQLLGALADALA